MASHTFPRGTRTTHVSQQWMAYRGVVVRRKNDDQYNAQIPLSSRQLPKNLRDAYSNSGISLSRAFSEIVWRAPRLRERSYWAILAKAAHDAYLQAWMHLLTVAYRKHFDPKADEKLGGWLLRRLFLSC